MLLEDSFFFYEIITIRRALVSYLFISFALPHMYESGEQLYKNHRDDNKKRGIPHTIPNKAKYQRKRRNNVKEGV